MSDPAGAGFVWLVGAGPGDPGLLTLRGAELLRQAEVIIYDGLVNPELLELARPEAKLVYGGKHDPSRCISQDEVNAMLVAEARQGKRVVRLKGGDPYLFGRGGEEAEVLVEAGIPFEVVPGVSSVQAVPAYAGIPLTHREHSSCVTIVTAHEDPASPKNKVDWARLAKSQGTLVLLMGLKHLRAIAAELERHGMPAQTPAAVISRGTTARQRTVKAPLNALADAMEAAKIAPPAITVIGEVVSLREKLDWFGSKSLTDSNSREPR